MCMCVWGTVTYTYTERHTSLTMCVVFAVYCTLVISAVALYTRLTYTYGSAYRATSQPIRPSVSLTNPKFLPRDE